MEKKKLTDLKPKEKFTIPLNDKCRVLVKYTDNRITTRRREGKCEILKLNGEKEIIKED